jgi:hypothetical protein
MSGLNAVTLLAAWERALLQTPVRRGLTILAAAWPEKSESQWALVSLGERDGYLLQLRDELFGGQLEATTICPACGERVQLTFATDAIRAEAAAQTSLVDGRFRIETAGYEMSCRLPTSADLIEVARRPESAGRDSLLRRCLTAQRSDGEVVDAASLPEQVVKTVIERMAEADPQAEVQIALTCPACAHGWSMLFDILSYVWSEIDDWAQRLLMEVHALAYAYGWSERDIISMSARRRRLYLEMVAGTT